MRVRRLTVVRVEQGLTRAHVIKGYLEEHGIPVVLQYESAGPAIGVTIDGLGAVKLLVPVPLAGRARRLLEQRREPLRPRKRRRLVKRQASRHQG